MVMVEGSTHDEEWQKGLRVWHAVLCLWLHVRSFTVYLPCLVLILTISKKSVLHLKILERLNWFEDSGNTKPG